MVRGKEVADVDSRAEEYPTLDFLEQDRFSFRVYETRSETGPSVAVLHPLGHLQPGISGPLYSEKGDSCLS